MSDDHWLPALNLVCLRVTLRCETPMRLPRWKGALLRGGLGHALHASFCMTDQQDQPCLEPDCLYHTLFAPETDAATMPFKGVRNAPRPFVVRPPLDDRTHFRPGDHLQFGMTLIGSATKYVPHMLHAFQTFGETGMGLDVGRATLLQAESYDPIQQTVVPLFDQGRFCNAALVRSLQHLIVPSPESIHLKFMTPMRIKARGTVASMPECSLLAQAAWWRLTLLAQLYGDAPWHVDREELLAATHQVRTRQCQTTWVDWSRTSGTTGQHMVLGGFTGRATYDHVPSVIGQLLQAGALVHLGKACVFGHGAYQVEAAGTMRRPPMRPPQWSPVG